MLLLDLDGVLYLGPDPVPHAAEAVAAARRRGVATAFVTNNSSRAPEVIAQHLRQLGIDASDQDVVTSAQAAARVVASQVPPGSAVLVIGTTALQEQVRSAGLRPVLAGELGTEPPAAVVQGLSPDITWRDLAAAAVAVRAGALWVAGNVDSTLPSPRGALPGNGTLVDAVRTATGVEPLVAGKPEPALHEESVRRTGARFPLVVGDRLDTDVAGAVRAGCPSLLVLTGVTDLAAVVQAGRDRRPDFVGTDLRALLRPQPPVTVNRGSATCDGARARLVDGVLHLDADSTAPGDDVRRDIAVLRAACACAWPAQDAGQAVEAVAGWPP